MIIAIYCLKISQCSENKKNGCYSTYFSSYLYKGTSKLFRNKKFMMDQKLQKETLIKIWKKNKAQIFFRPLISVSGF